MILTLAQSTVTVPTYTILTAVAFLFVCVILILTVLIQRPQGGGLSGAFGSGAGSGQTAFGSRTGDALTVATVGIFVVYLLIAIGLNFLAKPSAYGGGIPTVGGTPGANEVVPLDESADGATGLVEDGTDSDPATGEADPTPASDADGAEDTGG